MKNSRIGSKIRTERPATRAAKTGITIRGWFVNQFQILCALTRFSKDRRSLVPFLPPPKTSLTINPCIQLRAIIASLVTGNMTWAYRGVTFESVGCGIMSAIFPYLRNREYSVSSGSSSGVVPGVGGTNSILMKLVGYLYRSSNHGVPCTRRALTGRKMENQGFMGFSFSRLAN